MLGVRPAAVIAKPHIIPGFAKIERKTVIVIGTISASTLEQSVYQKNRISTIRPGRRGSFLRIEDNGSTLTSLLGRQGRVFLGVIHMPQCDDESVLSLHAERFHVKPYPSGVIGDITNDPILSTL
jgi:hypothetical protein